MKLDVFPPLPVRALALALIVVLSIPVAWRLAIGGDSVPGSPERQLVQLQLNLVVVVPERPDVPGYDRECGAGGGCVFGPAWSDHTDAPGAGNGCTTRQDVLRRDLEFAPPQAGSASCEVHADRFVDPYTGHHHDLARRGLRDVHIDHVFPLSAAWDLGASRWPEARRARFANDIDVNLLAVSAQSNTRKGDSTPGQWMPPDPRRHCFYANRYLSAALAYRLAITRDDVAALQAAIIRCPRRPAPG